ncbi:MAG: MurR/RpiR family transcriptional regulator, partial [Spirochaetales bacterium]|nr:MurR/RpiR family transcriptional regulator [Spirochaetales bacterium]
APMKAMLDKQLSARKAQEQKVMAFLRAHEDSVMDLSISEIAEGAGVSSPTVVRFCKSLGFEGLKDFKINFQAETIKTRQINEPITWASSDEDIRTLMKEKSAFSVQSLFSSENMDAMDRMAKAIVKADNIEIIGMGGSGIIAEYLFKELLRYGKKASLFSDPYMTVHSSVGRHEGDICIAISCSGTNNDVLTTVNRAKKDGKKIYSITNNGDSTLAGMSETYVKSCTVTGFMDEGNAFSRLSQFAAVNMITLKTALNLGRDSDEYKWNFEESSNYHNF